MHTFTLFNQHEMIFDKNNFNGFFFFKLGVRCQKVISRTCEIKKIFLSKKISIFLAVNYAERKFKVT